MGSVSPTLQQVDLMVGWYWGFMESVVTRVVSFVNVGVVGRIESHIMTIVEEMNRFKVISIVLILVTLKPHVLYLLLLCLVVSVLSVVPVFLLSSFQICGLGLSVCGSLIGDFSFFGCHVNTLCGEGAVFLFVSSLG